MVAADPPHARRPEPVVVSHVTQVGLLRLSRVFLAQQLRGANQSMLADLPQAADHGAATGSGDNRCPAICR